MNGEFLGTNGTRESYSTLFRALSWPLIASILLHGLFMAAFGLVMPNQGAEGALSLVPERHLLTTRLPPRTGAVQDHVEVDRTTDEQARAPTASSPYSPPRLTYYAANQLTELPTPATPLDLDELVPLAMGIGGKVVFRLWIDASGRVDRVAIDSSTTQPNFASAVASTLQRMRFNAGRINKIPVGSMTQFEVTVDE